MKNLFMFLPISILLTLSTLALASPLLAEVMPPPGTEAERLLTLALLAPPLLPEGTYKLDTDQVTCQNGRKLDLTSRHDRLDIYMTVLHEKEESNDALAPGKGSIPPRKSVLRMESRTFKKGGFEANDCYISSSGPFEYQHITSPDGEHKIINELTVEQSKEGLKKVCTGAFGGIVRSFAKKYASMKKGVAWFKVFENEEGGIGGFYLTREDEDGFTKSCKRKKDERPPTLRFVPVDEQEVIDIRPKP